MRRQAASKNLRAIMGVCVFAGCYTHNRMEATMGYLLLAGAIVCEVFATTMMRFSEGFSKMPPTVACVIGYVVCFTLFGRALLSIPLNIGYAVWCGVGIVATSVIAVVFFGEHLTAPIVIGTAFILVGTIIVNMAGAH